MKKEIDLTTPEAQELIKIGYDYMHDPEKCFCFPDQSDLEYYYLGRSIREQSESKTTSQPMIFIDLETANSLNQICAIAAIVVRNGEITKKVNQLVKPIDNFETKYSKIHNITSNDVKDKPTIDIVWKNLFDFYTDDYFFVCHHSSGGDVQWLINDLGNHGVKYPLFKFMDSCQIARKFIPKEKFGNHKLKTLCEGLGLPIPNKHNTLEDAIACYNLFNYLITNFDINLHNFYDCKYYERVLFDEEKLTNEKINQQIKEMKFEIRNERERTVELEYLNDTLNEFLDNENDEASTVVMVSTCDTSLYPQEITKCINIIKARKCLSKNEAMNLATLLKSFIKKSNEKISELHTKKYNLEQQQIS